MGAFAKNRLTWSIKEEREREEGYQHEPQERGVALPPHPARGSLFERGTLFLQLEFLSPIK